MLSKIKTAVCTGIEGRAVCVETDISNGLPNMNIVGLASTTVIEARERIKSAIINSGFEFPKGRITVNLTPAGLRKNGSYLDLPIAAGVLTSNGYVNPINIREYGIIGELSLDGSVLGIDCLLPILLCMRSCGIKKIIIPESNYSESQLIDGVEIITVSSLCNCISVINGDLQVNDAAYDCSTELNAGLKKITNAGELDFSDIKGQESAKRVITIAVTGRHGLLMMGSPGCGKTMLARRIPTIMPEMTSDELLETAIIYSVTGENNRSGSICTDRPFRSPHNSIGTAGLLGGGSFPRPGEITLAHNGVLFLDEVCEFDRYKIESLRLPVETGHITHFRNGMAYRFPCSFQLIMATNPCKCGYYGDTERLCTCTQNELEQYRRRLSGPMMDRIDLRMRMEKVTYNEVSGTDSIGMSSSDMKKDVLKGMDFARSMGRSIANGRMSDKDIEKFCTTDVAGQSLLENAYSRMHLSPRSYRKVLKVARTIADIDTSTLIRQEHIAEALSYRMFDEINNDI